VLVFDLGGGTFDVSLVNIDKQNFKVKAVSGDTHLGGEDFDNRLVDFCLKLFKDEKDIVVENHPRALRRLRTQCEKAKRILSNAPEVEIECDALAEGEDFSYAMTRAKFEDLIRADLDKIAPCLDSVLTDAKLSKE
jgi:L1 cell adhesion molecule like protein